MFNELKILFSPLNKKERWMLRSIDRNTITIYSQALTYYKRNVKHNRLEDKNICKKKLIRNIVLGEEIEQKGFTRTFRYGNLFISYNDLQNAITWVENKVGFYPYKISKKKKDWLNKFLGIE